MIHFTHCIAIRLETRAMASRAEVPSFSTGSAETRCFFRGCSINTTKNVDVSNRNGTELEIYAA